MEGLFLQRPTGTWRGTVVSAVTDEVFWLVGSKNGGVPVLAYPEL